MPPVTGAAVGLFGGVFGQGKMANERMTYDKPIYPWQMSYVIGKVKRIYANMQIVNSTINIFKGNSTCCYCF
jgi:hypothetical protein